jgi:hypothetical protein
LIFIERGNYEKSAVSGHKFGRRDLLQISRDHQYQVWISTKYLEQTRTRKKRTKPLENVVAILFENGSTEVISAMDLEMYFDQCIGR